MYLSINDMELHIGGPMEKSKVNKSEGFIQFKNQLEGKQSGWAARIEDMMYATN